MNSRMIGVLYLVILQISVNECLRMMKKGVIFVTYYYKVNVYIRLIMCGFYEQSVCVANMSDK